MTEKELLNAGFEKEDHPLFPFKKDLIDKEYIIENELDEDSMPVLLYGTTGINTGFCVYTGEHFIFFNAKNPKDAVEWAEKITDFEPV